jgi:Spy/CpxP family protein refolding chaperone
MWTSGGGRKGPEEGTHDVAAHNAADMKSEMKEAEKAAPKLFSHTRSELPGAEQPYTKADEAAGKKIGAEHYETGEARVIGTYRDATSAAQINSALRGEDEKAMNENLQTNSLGKNSDAKNFTGRFMLTDNWSSDNPTVVAAGAHPPKRGEAPKEIKPGEPMYGHPATMEYSSYTVGKAVEQMDAAIGRSTAKADVAVYRNMGAFGGELKVGDTFSDKGYVSSTMSPKFASEVGKWVSTGPGQGNIARIVVPKGQNALYADKRSGNKGAQMNEVLLPRGTSFKVEAISGGTIHLSIVKGK